MYVNPSIDCKQNCQQINSYQHKLSRVYSGVYTPDTWKSTLKTYDLTDIYMIYNCHPYIILPNKRCFLCVWNDRNRKHVHYLSMSITWKWSRPRTLTATTNTGEKTLDNIRSNKSARNVNAAFPIILIG